MANSSPAQVFSAHLLAALAKAGVRNFFLAPGARSQALAIAAGQLASAGKIDLHVRLDERSLGFTALGTWLSTQLPGSDTDAALHPIRYAQVMRARLAQHLLDPSSEENLRAEVYLAALFAQLDRLEQKPLGDLLNKLPLSGRIYDVLLRQDGPYHPLLDIARAQGEFDRPHQLPAICEQHDMGLEIVNRGLIRMLATSRDHAAKRSERLL